MIIMRVPYQDEWRNGAFSIIPKEVLLKGWVDMVGKKITILDSPYLVDNVHLVDEEICIAARKL